MPKINTTYTNITSRFLLTVIFICVLQQTWKSWGRTYITTHNITSNMQYQITISMQHHFRLSPPSNFLFLIRNKIKRLNPSPRSMESGIPRNASRRQLLDFYKGSQVLLPIWSLSGVQLTRSRPGSSAFEGITARRRLASNRNGNQAAGNRSARSDSSDI